MTHLQNAGVCGPTTRSVPPDGLPFHSTEDAIGIAEIAGLELFPWQADVFRDATLVRAAHER